MIRKYRHHEGVLSCGFFNRGIVKVFFDSIWMWENIFSSIFCKLVLFSVNLVQLSIVFFVVSFSEISGNLSMKRDVRESWWCLWCLLLKSHEIWAWNEICRRIHNKKWSNGHHRHYMNSLAHLGSCSNLVRFQ